MNELKIIDKAVIKAVEEYLDRKARKSHPSGSVVNAGRWYTSDDEYCD